MNRLLYSALLSCGLLPAVAQNASAPNIVLIMCDDMGFSDIGCYGSEIQTPNLDKLAAEGVRFSQFKNTGRSCPSRAALLTGRYQHEVGMGWMAEVDEHRPGYRGQIDKYGDKRKNRMEGQVCRQPAHIIDILPTCMALGQAIYPERFEHADLPGRSLLPAAEGKPVEERTFYFEHQSSCGIIDGHWKLVKANRNAQWELIDLDKDPFETNDLARQYPEKVEELEAKWIEWANTHKVFPLENRTWTERINFYRQKNPDQRGEE